MALERRFRPTLYARCVHVETVGRGPRVVLVHGSVGNGASTWAAQRPLAERFTLVIPDRPGSPPNPPVDRVDFEEQAPLRPEAVRSLTVIEPPAFALARGYAEADRLVAALLELWARAGSTEPATFLREFASRVGSRRSQRRPSRSSPSQAATAPGSTRCATCWRSAWAPSGPCFRVPRTTRSAHPG